MIPAATHLASRAYEISNGGTRFEGGETAHSTDVADLDLFEGRSGPNVRDGSGGEPPGAPASDAPPGSVPAADELKARSLDGLFMGAGTAHFPAGTRLVDVTPVLPAGGVRLDGTLVFINGVANTPSDHFTHLQSIADRTGQKTIGIYNATDGVALDLIEAAFDKLERWHYEPGRNPAVDALSAQIYEAAKEGRSLHLLAHSQGGLVTSLAVEVASRRLRDDDRLSAEAVLAKLVNVRIETFGSAAHYYPDGPTYVHYMNRFDSVASAVGFLWLDVAPLRIVHPGSGAVSHSFMEFHLSFSARHSLRDVYLPRRLPFDVARSSDRGDAHPSAPETPRETRESP